MRDPDDPRNRLHPQARRLRPPRRLSRRLIAVVTVLLCATSLTVGAATVLGLHGYLLSQLDARLGIASQRTLSAAGITPPSPSERPRASDRNGKGRLFVGSPGQSSNTVVALFISGKAVFQGYIDEEGHEHSLSSATESALRRVPVDKKPHTLNLPGLGDYRLESSRTPTGAEVVTGLPLSPLQDTVDQLIIVIGLVTAAALVAAGVIGGLVIRRSLDPLSRVAATALAVTGLTLDRGRSDLPLRVAPDDILTGSEVGRVGTALNELLGHVETALAARNAAEEKLRAFVADASHELRTPLATIRAYAELSDRDFTDDVDELWANAARIELEAKRMTALVEDLLLLAHLDAEPELESSRVDLSGIVADAVEGARAVQPADTWTVHAPSSPVIVTGDGVRLRQVIVNLLTNARVHTPPGTTVDVSLRLSEAGDAAIVDVVDDGPGIPAETLPLVFERFVRGDGSRSRSGGGTGLGLAIAHSIVTAHGGTLDVESRPGLTRFRIALPRL